MKLNKGTPFDRNWINGYTLIRHLKRWINPGSGSPGNLEHVCLTLAVQLEDTCRILVVVRFPCGASGTRPVLISPCTSCSPNFIFSPTLDRCASEPPLCSRSAPARSALGLYSVPQWSSAPGSFKFDRSAPLRLRIPSSRYRLHSQDRWCMVIDKSRP